MTKDKIAKQAAREYQEATGVTYTEARRLTEAGEVWGEGDEDEYDGVDEDDDSG